MRILHTQKRYSIRLPGHIHSIVVYLVVHLSEVETELLYTYLVMAAHVIGDDIIDWIEQWLTDRRQRVVVDGEVSNWK